MRICVVGEMKAGHLPRRAELIASLGHEVVRVTPAMSGSEEARDAQRAGGGGYVGRLWRCYRLLCDGNPDIVHVHYALGLGAWLALVAGRRPLIVSIMGNDVLLDEYPPLNWPAGRLTRLLLRHADLVTSKSDHLSAAACQLGVRPDRIVKIIWGIDPAAFRRVDAAPLRRELGLAAEDRVIFSPRALQPLYNINLLVDAMPAILRQVPTAKLLLSEFAADPPYRAALRAAIDRLGLGASVRLVGTIAHERMAAFYSLSELAVGIPSSDGLPQSLLEAAACGTPMVVSNLERYREFVRPEEGAVFVDLDAGAVAEGICRMLGDADLRARLIDHGRHLALGADTGNQLRLLDQSYRQLTAAHAGQRVARRIRLEAAVFFGLFVLLDGAAAVWRRLSAAARFRSVQPSGADT
jgi:glycosyltransferase involved in cell wall biosynthesis